MFLWEELYAAPDLDPHLPYNLDVNIIPITGYFSILAVIKDYS
jgi:hypothetical protein